MMDLDLDDALASEASQRLDEIDRAACEPSEDDSEIIPDRPRSLMLWIQAGAGGSEACVWSEMLLGMYDAWCKISGNLLEVLDCSTGRPKGFKSVVARISGPTAWRLLSESGVHRLCRVSEFGQGERHTSFSSVVFLPEVDPDEVDIDEADLKVETFRSGGKGGQHQNKTDSAVRITHLPTGITAQCRDERSQHSNRRSAMSVLSTRLEELHREAERSTINVAKSAHGPAKFGNRKRSYVLHPHRLVKDHQTGVKTSDVDGVLAGELEPFLDAGIHGGSG